MTQAIHTLDLFRSLVGGVERVSALATTTAIHRMECEDYVSAILVLDGGAVGNVMATTAAIPVVLTGSNSSARTASRGSMAANSPCPG